MSQHEVEPDLLKDSSNTSLKLGGLVEVHKEESK